MSYFQIVAILPAGRTKTIINKNENDTLVNFVIPFVSKSSIELKWGKDKNIYQVLELRIYKTDKLYDKKSGKTLEEFIQHAKNCFVYFERRAKKILQTETKPVFIVMPIQGEKFGSQNDQRIYAEYDERFNKIEGLLQKIKCTAIRIDKEYTLDELVRRIRLEIERAQFIIADLTDERPSCYYEAGYAEAKSKPIIFIASRESVINPGIETKIHFDIHRNVNYFVNHDEMLSKIESTINKNKSKLLGKVEDKSSRSLKLF